MKPSWITPGRALLGLCMAWICAPAWAAIPAHPGMLNYVEGQAFVDGRQVTSSSVGTAEVGQNQTLETGSGKAEILLTPGVFVRVGDNSALRVVSPGITNTRVALLKGEALVEVTQLFKQNNIQIDENGAITTVLKHGLYRFDADDPKVSVIDGEATVSQGDSQVKLKRGKEAVLTGPLSVEKFDRKATDDLYRWSQLRSAYLAEANAESARTYVVNSAGWYGGGWYWNPYFSMYSFIPGDGIFYSPFGYGFFSPWRVYQAPVILYRPGPRVGHIATPPSSGAVPRASIGPSRMPGGFSRMPGGSSRMPAPTGPRGGGVRGPRGR